MGEVFAHELAKKGCNLVLIARSKDKLDCLSSKLELKYRIKAISLPMDLTDSNASKLIWSEVKTRGIDIDILVNNAGAGTLESFSQINPSRILNEIQLNITSLTELTRLFLDPMIKKENGIIINVASMTAFQPTPYMAVYGASKSYVLSFTQALWAENRGKGIRILALCPGETKSSFHTSSGSDHLKGNRMEPIEVVKAAFRGIEKGNSYQIAGKSNYIMSLFSRLLPRKMVLNIAANMFKK
ncbi:SDR family NAD(P)-dependent oxidoreductase [Radiobacillus deserti]|uniref:SDR family NAD(P)-dependent oxidoreductase n=1 Tax=Radiobacillus deserti TaxID=2594883 RepID=UPI001E290902|nr:SDR family oxidoreductase [Radiobacillus deserti]